MIRRAFVLTAGSLLVLPPHRAAAQPTISTAYLGDVPGYIGVHARTMADGPPVLAYHDGEPFPTASTIKVLIMATAFRAIDAGEVSLQTPLRGSSLNRLLNLMIRRSDNDASNVLIDHFGFSEINATASAAGMTATRLRRHFLDWRAIVAHNENVSTARDMAALLYAIERGSREGLDTIAKSASCRSMIDIMLGQEDRDKIPRGLPPGTQIANKTGEITGVRSDVAIVEPFGEVPYVIAVMTKELRDYSAGVAAIARIARKVHRAVMTSAS
jgi:beta-lactamase class A